MDRVQRSAILFQTEAALKRRFACLSRLGRLAVILLGVVAVAWVLGLPQSAYRHLYVWLAYPVELVVDSTRGLTNPHIHVVSWGTWTHDIGARYAQLQTPAYRTLRGPIALEAALLALPFVLVGWRVLWFACTRVGTVTPSAAHGDARWMTLAEMRRVAYRPGTGALLLGCRGRRAVALPEVLQVLNTLVVGPPGSGKSAGLFIPNLLREDGRRGVVATDLKGELERICAGALAQTNEVWTVDFLAPERSRGYNPLAACTDPLATALFCDAWIANTGKSEREPFWDNAAREIMLAGIAHLQATLDDVPTLTHLEHLLCAHAPADVIAALEHSPAPAARRKARSFLAALKSNERLLGSAFAEITPRFLILADPRVQATTSQHEVDFARLADRGQRPIALFLRLDRTLQDELKPLAAAFFLDLFRALSTLADAAPDGALERPVMVYLDEFGNLGAVPKMPVWISTLRSAGVALMPAVQDTAQLTATYGEEGAATIKGSCATKIGLSTMGEADAKWFSDLTGQTTIVTQQANKTRGRFRVVSDRGSQTQSESKGQLLTPDQVRRLGTGELLAIVGEMAPVRLTQRRWYADPAVKGLANQGRPPARSAPLVPPDVETATIAARPAQASDGEQERALPGGADDGRAAATTDGPRSTGRDDARTKEG